jgi:hypothetical protein
MMLKTSRQLKLAKLAAKPRRPGALDQRSLHAAQARLGQRGARPARGEMSEILALPGQDRKNTWRFRRYSDGFAMDF